jgi:hypothetical protein
MLLPLTQNQEKVFMTFFDFYLKNQYPPTQIEVAVAVGKAMVSNEVQALKKKGWLSTIEGVGRRNTTPTEEAMERYQQNQLKFG